MTRGTWGGARTQGASISGDIGATEDAASRRVTSVSRPGSPSGQAPKPPVPAWRWASWWAILGVAIVVFYVLLTPVWLGIRALAWLADRRARAQAS